MTFVQVVKALLMTLATSVERDISAIYVFKKIKVTEQHILSSQIPAASFYIFRIHFSE